MFQMTGLRRVRRAQCHHTDLLGNLAADYMDSRTARRTVLRNLLLNQSKVDRYFLP